MQDRENTLTRLLGVIAQPNETMAPDERGFGAGYNMTPQALQAFARLIAPYMSRAMGEEMRFGGMG